MADDDGGLCGCIILLAILYAIYEGVKWAAGKYGWETITIACGAIIIIIVTTYSCNKIWEGASSLTEKGKSFINFGITWFISALIISFLLELWLTGTNKGLQIGANTFFITTFLNMPGTSILLYIGAKRLKSCDLETQIIEGRKIIYFGIFWLVFWILLPIALISLGIAENDTFGMFLLFVAMPGMVINVIIGKWCSRINVKKGWEDLNDAQKKFNAELNKFDRQQEKLDAYKDKLYEKQDELNSQQNELDAQQKVLWKQEKELQKLKDDIARKAKALNMQQEEIQRARGELETTWSALEEAIKKTPFNLFIKEKLNKDIFIKEIGELKRARPGDVSSIKTKADQIISGIKEELNKEITNIEDEYYYKAFLEYFKSIDGDQTEYDRIRIKYNPTIHIQADRRNKAWAERRRFDLSKIEKSMKEEKLKRE